MILETFAKNISHFRRLSSPSRRGGDTPITERRLQRSGKKLGQELIESPDKCCFIEGDVAWKRAKSNPKMGPSMFLSIPSPPEMDSWISLVLNNERERVAPLASWGLVDWLFGMIFFRPQNHPSPSLKQGDFCKHSRGHWNFTNRFMFDIIRMAIIWRDIPLSKKPTISCIPPCWAAGAVELRPWYPFWSRCRKRKPWESRGVLFSKRPERKKKNVTGWWVSNIFYVHPYLGEWSNLTYIFQMGWNRQLGN